MKKLKLLGSLAAMLLLPSVVHAEDLTYTATISNCTDLYCYKSGANLEQDASYPTGVYKCTTESSKKASWPGSGTNYIDKFKCGDFEFVCRSQNSTVGNYPKCYGKSTNKNIAISMTQRPYIVISNSAAKIKKLVFDFGPSSGSYSNLLNQLQIVGFTKSISGTDVTFTLNEGVDMPSSVVLNTASGNTAVALLSSVKITYEEAAKFQDIVTDFTAGTMPEGWSLYNNDSENELTWVFDDQTHSGLMSDFVAEDEQFDYWAVSPLINLPKGTYRVTMAVRALQATQNTPAAHETLSLTYSTELPNDQNSTEFANINYTWTGAQDASAIFIKGEGYVKTKPIRAILTISKDGEYYIGIRNITLDSASDYAWDQFAIQSITITEYEPQTTEWLSDGFKAECDRVSVKGKYDVQLKNGGATLTIGEDVINLNAAFNDNEVTFTGFPMFDGAVESVILNIPEDAYETSEGNAYPAVVNKTLNVEYNKGFNIISKPIEYDGENLVITMGGEKGYTTIEPTTKFAIEVKQDNVAEPVKVISNIEFNRKDEGNYSILTFSLPMSELGLEDGKYNLHLTNMAFRVKPLGVYSEQWQFTTDGYNNNSAYFTVTSTINFNDEVGNYYETIDNTFAQLKYGMLDADKNVIIPASVDYEGKTYFIKEIGEGAFKNKEYINDVQIPSVVTTIGKEAFAGSYIRNITIPANVVVIGEGAFNGASVGDLYLDNTSAEWALVSKGENAFAGNAFLYTYVHYPAGSDVTAYSDLDVDTEVGAFFPTHFVRGTESSLDINDGNHYYCIGNPATTVNVTYNRSYNGKWAGLFLPFEVKLSTITDLGGEAAELYKFDDERGLVWTKLAADAQNPDPVLKANTPYLVKMPANALNELTTIAEYGVDLYHHNNHGRFSLVNGEFKIVDDDADTSDCKYFLRGTFTTKTDMASEGAYAIAASDGNFHKASSDAVTLKPYRIFLVENPDYVGSVSNVAGAPIRCSIISKDDDTPTYVEGLEVEVLERDAYYDLQGNKVMNPERGVYILNGKKVVIK